jgi:hypothetical protein
MKTSNTMLQSTSVLCKGLFVLLIILAGSACRKNTSPVTVPYDLKQTANSLKGEILTGTLTTEGDDDGLALWVNGEKVLIGMGKTSQGIADPGTIQHVEIVYSNFGVIVRDINTNKLWYYIQNDPESKSKFASLRDTGLSPVTSVITETIKWNLS